LTSDFRAPPPFKIRGLAKEQRPPGAVAESRPFVNPSNRGPFVAGEIEFPQFYQGIYSRVQVRYRPHLEEALDRIKAIPVTSDLRPFLAFQTWENPQPSFMLFPLMFLATAEAAGGITEGHREYLPAIMLASELCAVADDTIDRAPRRSGRETFAAQFGDTSALPMACSLVSMVLDQSKSSPALFGAAVDFFVPFFGLELWECDHVYPGREVFPEWLEHRYAQAVVATEYVLNSALLLATNTKWPRAAVTAFSQIGQDVDDIVNVVEYREADGENDDIQAGVVTRPLIYALQEDPALGEDLEELWSGFRELAERRLPIQELQLRRADLASEMLPVYRRVRTSVLERGVPLAVKQCLVEFHTAVRETPAELRPLMRDLALAFLDRLRRCRYVPLVDSDEDDLAQAG